MAQGPSFGQLAGAIWHSTLADHEARVLLTLASFCECGRRDYTCAPGADGLAARSRLSRAAAYRALSALEERGLVRRVSTAGRVRAGYALAVEQVLCLPHDGLTSRPSAAIQPSLPETVVHLLAGPEPEARIEPSPPETVAEVQPAEPSPQETVSAAQPSLGETVVEAGANEPSPPETVAVSPRDGCRLPQRRLTSSRSRARTPSSDPLLTLEQQHLVEEPQNAGSSGQAAPTPTGGDEGRGREGEHEGEPFVLLPPDEPQAKRQPAAKAAKKDAKELVADARKVHAYWCEKHGKSGPAARLDTKSGKRRLANVTARLAEGYTVEQLCEAVDGCKVSPHHRGVNDTGTIYDDLELICRDDKHVEMFRRHNRTAAQAGRPDEPTPPRQSGWHPPDIGGAWADLTEEFRHQRAAGAGEGMRGECRA